MRTTSNGRQGIPHISTQQPSRRPSRRSTHRSPQRSTHLLTRIRTRIAQAGALAALLLCGSAFIPTAQAFQAVPNCLTDQPSLVTSKHSSRTQAGCEADIVAQLSSAPLVLTLSHVELRQDEANQQSVLDIRLTPESRQAFAQLTSTNVGRRVSLSAGGEMLTTVVIRGAIEGGAMTVVPGIGEHGLTEAKMKQIAEKLSSGKSKLEVSLLPRA